MRLIRPYQWLLLFGFWMAFPTGAFGQMPVPVPPECGPGIIFVANGSGDSTSVTEGLTEALGECRLPLSIYPVPWCRAGSVVKDHKDCEAQLWSGAALADQVMTYHALYPERKIYLMGHSAGTHVVLAAANRLPPDTVDRIVLLAPSVSYCYDLRCALQCARDGIDCYYSTHDVEVSVGVHLFNTADRLPVKAAGENGFACLPPTHPDAYLYCKLHQFPWNGRAICSGNWGSHYGSTGAGFLKAHVLPTMIRSDCIEADLSSDSIEDK